MTHPAPANLNEISLAARQLLEEAIERVEVLQDLASHASLLSRLGRDLGAQVGEFDAAAHRTQFVTRVHGLATELTLLSRDTRLSQEVANQRALVFKTSPPARAKEGAVVEDLVDEARALSASPLRARPIVEMQVGVRTTLQEAEAEAANASAAREEVATLGAYVAARRSAQARREEALMAPQDNGAAGLEAARAGLRELRARIARAEQ